MKTICMIRKSAIALYIFLCGVAPIFSQTDTPNNDANLDQTEVTLVSDILWGPLNPARGDASPKAGTLWGDRNGSGPSGFLVQFTEGFASPPHIHNTSYRGVVITGLIHNDDPKAEDMWLTPGAYWTQPAGDVHITSASGSKNMAYIEIEHGPYLVKPTSEAYENGEASINVDTSNIVWQDATNTERIQTNKRPNLGISPQLAFLWGRLSAGHLNGSLIKLPPGFTGEIKSDGAIFRSVVIQGDLHLNLPKGKGKILKPGSYFGSGGSAVHHISNEGATEMMIYVRTNGTYEVR